MSSLSTPTDLSSEFLNAVKRGEDSEQYRAELATVDSAQLPPAEQPNTATAFWVNVYNAFVQRDLKSDPSLYESKRRFFGQRRHAIAGTDLSLDDIEHGILRSSKWKYGLGYVPRPFASEFEREHRLPTVDPRIHFALNCGAESCPPIAAYSANALDSELETSTASFLQQSSRYDRETDSVWVTRLFVYYRGDFGGRSGIYDILERYDVIDEGERPRVRYDTYDWTLHRGMYRNH
ncbi:MULTISPECIES: DUF547 domain-containing protein [Haloferax]|uniref:DUF547 domain-containing protein n=2 Tax=Haloferax TaxID=2251 RepID=A0A6G1Z628_9EURY|nr:MULTISPECIES: DUF547 domain-containing protein [Haloferax]KAB1185369.1 DUF547 domain-containing protein [Haloferax sp. CBA1149]MRW82010.1 DUF547 domain-containing protein [Haloferax marinisediminis]